MPGCSAWGIFGNGRGYRCRQHVWDGFLPGSVERLTERDPATLPPLTLVESTPVKSQGKLL